ncbi:MAG: gliding motility-associated C-terminal domain-containing protein [Bacteroidota bacterium]
MKFFKRNIIYAFIFISVTRYYAQMTGCGNNVPFFQVNLSGQPSGVWYSPTHIREGNCCGTQSPDRCTSFEILLDSTAAMINFNIASGAIPPGAMYYQINCGPQIPVGQPICVTGPGPHHLTFCKPGNNQNTYLVQSIPKPMIPSPQHVRLGCFKKLKVIGLDSTTVTWNSIYPGVIGQFNSYLSCTSSCTEPTYNPPSNAPAFIDYQVCGIPIATPCGYVAMCDTVRVFNESPLSGSYSPNPAVFCYGSEGVTLIGTASGGYGSYSYLWRDQNNNIVSTSSQIQTSTAGNYSLEIKDALYNDLSCPSFSLNVAVNQSPIPVVSAGQDQILCYENQGVQLNGTITYATGGIWSGGNGNFIPNEHSLNAVYIPTASEISNGVVALTLTSIGSTYSCINSFDQVAIHFAPKLNVHFNNDSLPCFGDSVTLQTVASGGSPPYQYQWNNGSTQSFTTANEGQYSVLITDNMGCTIDKTVNIFSPLPLIINSLITPNNCNAEINGSVNIMIGGGSVPYQYAWSNGSTSQNINNLPSGNYFVVVTDKHGCVETDSFIVTQPDQIAVTLQHTNVTCKGYSDAVLNAVGSGGTPPYQYVWSNGITGFTQNNVSPGSYSVVITDANGCVFNDSEVLNILEPNYLQIVNSLINCPVPGSGVSELNFTIIGGWTNLYQLSLDGGSTFLPQGMYSVFVPVDSSYTVVIRDSLGCVSNVSKLITVNPELNIDQLIVPDCVYENDSLVQIYISASGGVSGDYTLNFSNGASLNISGIDSVNFPAGSNFEVFATDSLGCVSATKSFQINNVFKVESIVSDFSGYAVACNGFSNGAINLNPMGGFPPYEFEWNSGATMEDVSNLTSGSYSVIVTDQHSCKDTLNFLLSSPELIKIDSFILSDYNGFNVSCKGLSNGTIDLFIEGGVSPYMFNWNTGSNDISLSNLTAGNYEVVVTDSNHCVQSFSFQLSEPETIDVSVSSVSDYNGFQVSCNGESDALIQVLVSGFTGNVSYFCNNQSVSNNIDSLGAGTYSWYVMDDNGCYDTLKVVILEPPALSFSSAILSNYNNFQISCTGYYDGEINLEVNGGVGQNHFYQWSNSINTEDQYGLTAGSYYVEVTDSNGCKIDTNFILYEPLPINLLGLISSNYNGYAVSCYGNQDASIDINVTGGAGSYLYNWSNGSTTEDISLVGAGEYSVLVGDLNGCFDTLNFSINQPDSIQITENIKNIQCNGLSDGSIELTVQGGIAPFNYNWSNGTNVNSIENLTQGQYSIVVIDQNNCMQTRVYNISEKNPIQVETNVENVKCFGDENGQITTSIFGGTTPYTVLWSNGSTDQNISALTSGVYILNVIDSNNCFVTDTVIISEPDSLWLSLNALTYINGHNLSSANANDGTITTHSGGGTPPYNYQWSNGSVDINLHNLSSGGYTLTLTDFNGCVKISDIQIYNPNELELPTGFSPNSDYKNDQFVVRGIESYPNNTLYVFNRWGNLVYEKENYLNQWKGNTINGDELPEGTYFIILEIHSPTKQLNGFVDIRR